MSMVVEANHTNANKCQKFVERVESAVFEKAKKVTEKHWKKKENVDINRNEIQRLNSESSCLSLRKSMDFVKKLEKRILR